MRRRTFIAALPAAVAMPALAQGGAQPQARSNGENAPADAPLPRWDAGQDQYLRPDVGPGDRPVGASFASRTAAYGLHGAAGTAHPLATQAGIDDIEARRLRGGCRDRDQRVPGLSRTDQQRDRRRLLCDAVGPEAEEGGGDRRVWRFTARAEPRNRSRPRQERRAAAAGRGDRVGAGRGRLLVDAAPALRAAEMGRAVRAGDRAGYRRRALPRHHRLLHPPRHGGVPAAGHRHRGNRQCGEAMGQRAGKPDRSCGTPISPAPMA